MRLNKIDKIFYKNRNILKLKKTYFQVLSRRL